jgi:non-canonical purine NTP pyrophosphatase (RdgB/HAM1 family)
MIAEGLFGVCDIVRKMLKQIDVTFITGNPHKADYLSRLLELGIAHQKVDQDELQSLDLHVIVEHKLRQAYERIKRPVLVEDVSLEFCALDKLPGPYIKWFIESTGEEACCRMLDGFEDRSAIARCTFGYFDGKQMSFFDSKARGYISDYPKGDNGFGWDKIFINEGYDVTRAEMTPEENEQTYRDIMKPFAAVSEFLHLL